MTSMRCREELCRVKASEVTSTLTGNNHTWGQREVGFVVVHVNPTMHCHAVVRLAYMYNCQ